jgi:hypothetical protein
MIVLLDIGGLRIWVDGFSPIVFIHFSSTLSGEVSRASLKKWRGSIHAVISRFKSFYVVINVTQCGSNCPKSLLQVFFSYFPELFDEVKYVALVGDASQRLILDPQLDEISKANSQLQYESFQDFFAALGSINALRQEIIASHK